MGQNQSECQFPAPSNPNVKVCQYGAEITIILLYAAGIPAANVGDGNPMGCARKLAYLWTARTIVLGLSNPRKIATATENSLFNRLLYFRSKGPLGISS